MSTVMHTLFDVARLRLASGLPSDLVRGIETHKPIEPLFS